MTLHVPNRPIRALRSRKSLVAALVLALAAASHLAGAAPASLTVARATTLRPGDAVIGALPMKQPIHVEVSLRLRDKAELDAFVANAMSRPGTTPMTSAQFLASHAPTPAQAQAVASYLAGKGYTNITIAPNRLLVSADGTAATAREAFATTFAQIRTVDGRIAFANTSDAQIPSDLADTVLAVVGLQTVHIAHTFLQRTAPGAVGPMTVTGHSPLDFPTIYSASPAAAATDVTVGIITEGSLTAVLSDLAKFASANSLPAVSTATVNTGGTSSDTSGTAEFDLDSQDVVGMSGGVKQIIFYNMPNLVDSTLTANFNAIVAANKAKIISVSLGACETGAQGDGSAASDDQIFQTAVAQGQTFVFATGDSGADECGDGKTTPSWPASSQYAIAVTGTQLGTGAGNAWSSETVWTRSGGSTSLFEPIPSWQKNFGIAGTKRVAADVAFDGDPASGVNIYVNGVLTGQYGGTSLSAPLFAGVWARVLHAKPTVGFAGPVLYGLKEADFHDITIGSNGGGSAKPGYDAESGRGSMKIGAAVADIAPPGNRPPTANFSSVITGLTAHFIDTSTDSDGTIASHSWTFGDGATSTLANPVHEYAAGGNFRVTETVKDNGGLSASKTSTVKAAIVHLFQNTGFETGTASPWTITPASVLTNNASLAHAGSWLAALGGGSGAHTDRITQTSSLPAAATSATLSFYLHLTTAETTTTAVHDSLNVQVLNSAGNTVLATLGTYTNLNATSGYVVKSFDMTPYLGQTVRVRFTGINNATLATTWDVDDVQLLVR